jgi:hypothetical protein
MQNEAKEINMRKLLVFNLITLDGYFAGQEGDISWHNVDKEFQELAKQASNSGYTLLFRSHHIRAYEKLLADSGSHQK